MQVLNQAFANANNAFNAYMRNDLDQKQYDTSRDQWNKSYDLQKSNSDIAKSSADRTAFKDVMMWADGQDHDTFSKNMATLSEMANAGHLQGIEQRTGASAAAPEKQTTNQ